MDDTRHPSSRRSAPRAGVPFIIAALTLGAFAILCVWPPVIPGLPRAPRLVLLAFLLAGSVRWLMGRPARASRRPGPASRRPGPSPVCGAAAAAVAGGGGAWLHVVSAAGTTSLARGSLEIAGALIGGGASVLVVDGARRLSLHERLGLRESPGLIECLAGDLHIMNAVQRDAGGLSFLARGNPMRPEVWPQLGRLLGALRTRFDRVLLVLDFAVPHEAGRALEGLDVQGWWVFDGARTGLASAVEERLGIPLRNIGLEPEEEAIHEVAAWPRETPRAVPAPPPAHAPLARERATRRARRRRIERAVLDSDLQVRERLRFLIWMKQLQAESQRRPGARHRATPDGDGGRLPRIHGERSGAATAPTGAA